jgi:Sulfatase-modifying factor enzyme 1
VGVKSSYDADFGATQSQLAQLPSSSAGEQDQFVDESATATFVGQSSNQSDALFDVFLTGAQVLENPFGSAQEAPPVLGAGLSTTPPEDDNALNSAGPSGGATASGGDAGDGGGPAHDCCRAGAVTARYYGRSEELLPKYAWYLRNAKDRSWPVGSLKPNDLGLFDMHGSAWNWCSDGYISYKPGTGPRSFLGIRAMLELAAPTGGAQGWPAFAAELSALMSPPELPGKVEMVNEDFTYQILVIEPVPRVMRGGSFLFPTADLRCANRNWVRPSYRNYNVGFRVARTLDFQTRPLDPAQ